MVSYYFQLDFIKKYMVNSMFYEKILLCKGVKKYN